MPVLWAINHPTRMVVATANGALHLKDIEEYLEGVALAATLSYRKIFDMSHCSSELSNEDMLALGARIRGYTRMTAMGPVAIVAGSDEPYQQALLFESLAVADRPLKIFRKLQSAYDWLDEPALAPEHQAVHAENSNIPGVNSPTV